MTNQPTTPCPLLFCCNGKKPWGHDKQPEPSPHPPTPSLGLEELYWSIESALVMSDPKGVLFVGSDKADHRATTARYIMRLVEAALTKEREKAELDGQRKLLDSLEVLRAQTPMMRFPIALTDWMSEQRQHISDKEES